MHMSEDRRVILQYKTQRFQKINSGRGFKSKVSKNLSAEHNFWSTTKSAFEKTLITGEGSNLGCDLGLTCAGFNANAVKVEKSYRVDSDEDLPYLKGKTFGT